MVAGRSPVSVMMAGSETVALRPFATRNDQVTSHDARGEVRGPMEAAAGIGDARQGCPVMPIRCVFSFRARKARLTARVRLGIKTASRRPGIQRRRNGGYKECSTRFVAAASMV